MIDNRDDDSWLVREIGSLHSLLTNKRLISRDIWQTKSIDNSITHHLHVVRNESWEPYLFVLARAVSHFQLNLKLTFSSLSFTPFTESIPDCHSILIWFSDTKWDEDKSQIYFQKLFDQIVSARTERLIFIVSSITIQRTIENIFGNLYEGSIYYVSAPGHEAKGVIPISPINSKGLNSAQIATVVDRLLYSVFLKDIIAVPRIICLDLDNTLVGGIISELGSGNLFRHEFLLQNRLLKNIRKAGVLLCLVTRNEERDVLSFFQENGDNLGLELEDFVIVKSSWRMKSVAIGEILDIVNLHPSQCLFVDDNINELLDVKHSFPDVKCLLASTPGETRTALEIIFGELLSSGNMSNRTNMNILREKDIIGSIKRSASLKHRVGTFDTFLIHKELETRILPSMVTAISLSRANELLAKTNQFNMSLTRTVLKKEDLKHLRVYESRVVDKFADSGIVSICIVDHLHHIKEFVVSCRVLGRDLETYLLWSMLSLDTSLNRSGKYVLEFRAGPRNVPSSDFMLKISGFPKSPPEQVEFQASELGDLKIFRLLKGQEL